MEELGKEGSISSSRPFPWLSPTKTEASTLLWKLKDCFSNNVTQPANTNKGSSYMEGQQPVLDLKDVPPPRAPLHHNAPPLPSQRFPLAPHPIPSTPCLPPPPQIPQQPAPLPFSQQKQGPCPKVSTCSYCEYCSSGGYKALEAEAGVSSSGSIEGTLSFYMASSSLGAPSPNSKVYSSGPCSIASSVQYKQNVSSGRYDEALATWSSHGYPSQMPSFVATSQPVSSHPYAPGCTGLLPSSLPLSCSQSNQFSSLAPPVSSLPSISEPLHGSCLASSGYYPCGADCSPLSRRAQRSETLGEPTTTTTISTTTTTTSSHFCSIPMHLKLERTVGLKGAQHCQECFLKPGTRVLPEPDKIWPNVPPLQTAPIPICNGCGTSADVKTGQKYGSPESGGPENIPPVGVFWDIENCSVPSGRSAAAVVERIRSRFFQGHREAEFICVCDISKENKSVIQELNNCQVTVAHINATAKNAADDKLRQCLRRFAETHTAPATVVLVSSDVNFASELSDLRHRHGFQVILVHNHASPALLQHANCHVAFQEITADLPPRMVNEKEVSCVDRKPNVLPDKGPQAVSSSPRRNDTGTLAQVPKSALTGESLSRRRRDGSSPRSTNNFPIDGERTVGEFQISTPSAFSKLNLQRSFSPLVLSQGSWSSRSVSPCLSSRSSPLLAPPRSPCPETPPEPFSDGAQIQAANLDYRMSRKDLQQCLHDTFSRYGQVKSVELSPHTDYQLKAKVQIVSLQDAICAVSGLHRYKIGGKRIQVSLVTGGSNKSLALLSGEIISILHDAPANCLPLFKLTEIYEKKFSRKLMVGDLYKLPEVVSVREQGGSRLVCLLHSSQIRQSPLGSSQSQEGSSSASGSPVVFEELEYHEPICRQHYALQHFSEADFDPDTYKIPFVVMSVSTLMPDVHTLLHFHEGTLPLLSFPDCYAAKFSPLQLGNETLEGGVPLEHLITSVPSITIVTAQNGFKIIKWIHNKPPSPNIEPWIQRCKSPVGNPQLIQFSREIIDLLKSQASCIMPLSMFIPSYHHHFAKQCRVSDYGFSKLLELLEAVPHVLQILGMGTKRLLTLTHRAQVKRFTQDLLKLLKFQASKQVAIKDFMQAYHWCFSRDWRVIDYGVCDLMDLLNEIPDTTITITHGDTDTVISVPKRERTSEEMDRTKQFGKEVVDLLRHQPHCRMLFSKFIPTYHHHFGRQCKLSYYGFTKLIELFEAIPDLLVVLECGEEKVLTLTEVERIKALAAQLVKLLRAQKNSSLPVKQLLTEYSKTFGYGLRLQDYDASSLPALLAKLCHVVKVEDGSEGREVQLINRKSLRSLTSQILALLMSQDEEPVSRGLRVDEVTGLYMTVYAAPLNPCEYGFLSLSELLKSLPYLVELYYEDCEYNSSTLERVRLTRLYQFARNVRALLQTYHYNQIFLTEFPGAYHKFTGCSLEPRSYGYNNVDELLSAIPQVVWIKGHSHKRIIVLKNDMKGRVSTSVSNSPQPSDNTESPRESPVSSVISDSHSSGVSELLSLTSPVDLLCGPVPSCLPSPQLHPDPVLQLDLIHFGGKLATTERSEAAAERTSESPEQENTRDTEDPEVTVQLLSSNGANSPRRVPRSRFKLAANFTFSTGL
ncbi:meiosis regulator and mRNA stability factor 1 isoform X3 [Eucyclogobius newberryi]|uniref:meiosis regulator and mRNA stability factor 1 isoform X3 n=1 Tax=Eucyclogobius newberryi TaxID=166745 RepID=UPI003B5A2D8D